MDSASVVESLLDGSDHAGLGGCHLDELLDYVNGLPRGDLKSVASIGWWRAMGRWKMGARSRVAEMYIVSMCAARMAEEGLLDPAPHF